MIKKLLILNLVCLFVLPCFGQSEYSKFKNKLNAKLELLSSFPHDVYEKTISFDPDSLTYSIAEDLTDFLRSDIKREFNVEDFPLMETPNLEEDSAFKVFVFGYHSGGSAGWIPHCILVRNDSISNDVYNLSYIEGYFCEFYKLEDETYLCMGYALGSGGCENNIVYAIDFSGVREKAVSVFGDKPFFYICNSDIEFDNKEQTLTINAYDLFLKNEEDCKSYLENLDFYYFSIDCYNYNDEEYAAILKSRYNGERFVKP